MNPTLQSYFNGTHTEADLMDFVEQKLLEQGRMSINGSSCAYRSEDGCKCAIGYLIPDEHYLSEMDKPSAVQFTHIRNIILMYHDTLHIDINDPEYTKKVAFIQSLQYTHDDLRWQEEGKFTNEGPQWHLIDFAKGIKKNINHLRSKYV
jgi:hypothetical protein